MKLTFACLPVAFFAFALPASAASLAVATPPSDTIAAVAPTPDSTCAAESTSKSAGSFTPTSFTITNNSDVPLTLFWIDFKGVRENWGPIAPSATNNQGDYTGHVWVAAITSSGLCVHLFTSTLTPLQVSVGTASVAPSATPYASASPKARSAPPGSGGNAPASFSTSNQPPISSALASPWEVFSSPVHTLINVAVAAALVLFITFPAQLFNHTLEENYAEIRRRLVHFLRLPARLATREVEAAPATLMSARTSALVFWAVVVVGALLGALLNPHFGFNLSTLLALSATAITILWGLGVAYSVSFAFRRARNNPSPAYFKALPAGLIIAGLCVLASRLSDFQPGYLYGLVYSVAFAAKLPRNQDGQLTALSALSGLGLAVLAWLAWTPLHTLNAGGVAGIALLVATSVLASLFVGGLVGSVLSLAPLRFLSGHKLFSWRREVWAILFGLAVFLILQVLLLPAKGGHAGNAPIVTAIIFFIVFGVFSVVFWWYFARRKDKETESAVDRLESKPGQIARGSEIDAPTAADTNPS